MVLHPVFGELNFEEWALLHYKHVTHPLRRFGLLLVTKILFLKDKEISVKES